MQWCGPHSTSTRPSADSPLSDLTSSCSKPVQVNKASQKTLTGLWGRPGSTAHKFQSHSIYSLKQSWDIPVFALIFQVKKTRNKTPKRFAQTPLTVDARDEIQSWVYLRLESTGKDLNCAGWGSLGLNKLYNNY